MSGEPGQPAASAGVALGQAGWVIAVDYGPGETSVHRGNPTCTVRISAMFAPSDYAMAAARVDVMAWETGWGAPHPSNNLPPMTVGSSPGAVSGACVMGIVGSQLGYSTVWGSPNAANPIGFWESTWSTTHFTPRSVSLFTRSGRFDVYPERTSPIPASRMTGLIEGSGGIVVTPTPSACVGLGLVSVMVCGRRRRSRAGCGSKWTAATGVVRLPPRP